MGIQGKRERDEREVKGMEGRETFVKEGNGM
jgi:hypothetical protein